MRPHQKFIHLDISHGRHLRRERLQIDGRASLGNLDCIAAAKDDRLSLATFQIGEFPSAAGRAIRISTGGLTLKQVAGPKIDRGQARLDAIERVR